MVKGRYIEGLENLGPIKAMRQDVFKDEMGLDALGSLTEEDSYAVHAVAFDDDDNVVAVGRITYDGDRFDVSHIAVDEKCRKMEYGDFILKMLINKAVLANADEMYALTLSDSEGFFERVGFKKIGEEEIDGIKYSQMKLSGQLIHCCSGCHGK